MASLNRNQRNIQSPTRKDKESSSSEYTALQYAARRGSISQVRRLIEDEASSELDAGPDPALHLALRQQHTSIALYLLESGADFETGDSYGDYPIHIACALGLLEVAHTLCTLGCNVELPTAGGLFPLHLAAKHGHIHVVRCLCAAGCNTDVRNFDNIRADITALKHGHNDIADLLDRLRATGQRDTFARQLVPTSKPALRLSLRLLGHCGVGKTALIKSLGAGLFSSLFRRSSSLHSNKSRPSSPINNGQIEMDVTTSRQNSLSFESSGHYLSTQGIHVQNMYISGVGDSIIWEFSGHENYFSVYHHFLGAAPHSLTVILFSLEESPSIQVQQVCFWLNFVLARQPADLPSSDYGQILLVATHVDLTRAVKNQNGEWLSPDAEKTLETVRKLLPHMPNLMTSIVVMDANVPASYAFKQLKAMLSALKQDCIQEKHLTRPIANRNKWSYNLVTTQNFKQTIGTWTGLLEATLTWIVSLQKDYEQCPILCRSVFADLLRRQVNILASDRDIHELLQQLHAMGEVFCVRDLIVIYVPWLGNQLIGDLLSFESRLRVRATGVYTLDDFQATFNQCDAVAVLDLLEAMDVCVRCVTDGEIEYEFPIYNQIETLEGLWDSTDPRYSTNDAQYGGVRLYTGPGIYQLFKSIFSHIQIELRRSTLANYSNNDSDTDLYQWCTGSKLCNVDLESLITLDVENAAAAAQFIEIKIRGPNQSSKYCFYFLEQLMQTINRAVMRVCPGLLIERHILSQHELKMHAAQPYCYEPGAITAAMMDAESTLDVVLINPNIDKQETVVQLIMFNAAELAGNLQWGCALKIAHLSAPAKLRLCGLLDPPDPHGRDWCCLALRLGLCPERIAALDLQQHTMKLLATIDCSIGAFIVGLQELDRLDAAEVVLRSAPVFQVLQHISDS